MNELNRETRHLLVKSLLNVVDRSPTISSKAVTNALTPDKLKIWVDYALAVIDVFADCLSPYDYRKIKQDIEKIYNETDPYVASNNVTYLENKALRISKLLLEFAKKFI